MNKIIKYTATLVFSLTTLGQALLAQGDASLMGSRVDPVRIAQNPAYISEERVVIGVGLSSLSTRAQLPLSVSQILSKTSETKSKLYLDEALTKLGGQPATMEVNFGLFLFGLRTKAGFFTLGANLHAQSEGRADKKLTDFFASGNGPYRGKQVLTKGLEANVESRIELALGYATDRLLSSGKLSVGGRVKVLFGQMSARTHNGLLNILTSQDGHELTIEGYQQLQLRMPNFRYTHDALGHLDKLNIGIDQGARVSFTNPGFGLDLGASYKLDDRLTLGLSLRNLGFIKWTDGHLLTLDKQGSNALHFKGIDISSALTAQKNEDQGNKVGFEAIGEEIKRHLTVQEHVSYTTSLPLKLHAMADYQALRWLSLSAMAGMSKLSNSLRPDLALAVNCMPTRGIGAHLSVSSLHGSPINLGAGLVLGRRVQFHLAIDNLLMLNLSNVKYAHLSTGLNFRF
ncbi:MAG: DUF5723 family protein [Porphyromonadaceae bacterium]|nr:DUF5723 family protein [Porphyromonadaceae bacterium]